MSLACLTRRNLCQGLAGAMISATATGVGSLRTDISTPSELREVLRYFKTDLSEIVMGEYLWKLYDINSIHLELDRDPLGAIHVISETLHGRVWVRQYSGGVKPEWFGPIGHSLAKDTEALQAALNMGETVELAERIYMFEPGPDRGFVSNNRIIGSGFGSVIKLGFSAPPHTKTIQQVLRPKNYENVENLTIANLCIDGNMRNIDWSNVRGDGNGFGIGLWGTQQVRLSNLLIRNCWTDGVYVAYSHSSKSNRRNSAHIRMSEGLTIRNCGRQGMSIISAESLYCDRINVKGVNRTAPRAAIDIEPNLKSPDRVFDISFDVIQSADTGAGVIIAGVSVPEKIRIGRLECTEINATYGLSIASAKDVVIDKAILEKSASGTYPVVRISDFENVHIKSCTSIVHSDVSNGVQWNFEVDGTRLFHQNTGLRVDYLRIDGSRAGGLRTENDTTSSFGRVETMNLNRANYALGHSAILAGNVLIEEFENLDNSHLKVLDILSPNITVNHLKLRRGGNHQIIERNGYRTRINRVSTPETNLRTGKALSALSD